MYVLFFGRIVTSLGTMVHFLLTLILSNKLNMTATAIASLFLGFSIVQLPVIYFAGHLTDHYNKRNIIIICDLVTVLCYCVAGLIPLSLMTVFLIFIASLFASVEHPVYDALIADLSSFKDREKAFSLNYLGMNLGTVLAPSLGGFLFTKHLDLVFFIDAFSTLLSTILIFVYVKDISRVNDKDEKNIYEESIDDLNVWQVLKQRKIIAYFIVCTILTRILYSQFDFLMPLNFEGLYGERGALIFGTMTSVNGFVVIVGTPILMALSSRFQDVFKLILGVFFMTSGYFLFIFIQGKIIWYYLAMIIFTIGEIYQTLGIQPYLTRRIPATHRGRITSISLILTNVFVALAQNVVGYLIDHHTFVFMWVVASDFGLMIILMLFVLYYFDRKEYFLLYSKEDKETLKDKPM